MANALVRDAALQAAPASKRGILERVFARMFEGLVYAQIWEDPEVDLAALELGPTSRVVTIASGGCNVMSYLVADPAGVQAVDLNPAHVALLKLKLAAARHLPHHEAFRSFFADAGDRRESAAVPASSSPRAWSRRCAPSGTGATSPAGAGSGCSGATSTRPRPPGPHHPARATSSAGCTASGRSASWTRATSPSSGGCSRTSWRPVFDSRFVRRLADLPAAYFGLGIPPAQFDALKADAGGDLADLLRRVERLACDFPIQENWFAWQAFGRRYPGAGRGLPPYLRPENFAALRERVARVDDRAVTITDFLRRQDARTVDAYVLLDAQDWMSRAQIAALWEQINRTARPGAG